LGFRFDLFEFIQQGLVTDSQFDGGAFSVAAGQSQNFGDQLALDLD
jgi:hypothetical protein